MLALVIHKTCDANLIVKYGMLAQIKCFYHYATTYEKQVKV